MVRHFCQLHDLPMPPAFLEDNGLEPLTRKDFWRDLRAHGLRFKVMRDAAFNAFSERGSYPLAHRALNIPWPQIADQLNETAPLLKDGRTEVRVEVTLI